MLPLPPLSFHPLRASGRATNLPALLYIPLPLEATYQSAWEAVPAYGPGVLTTPTVP